MSGAVVIDSKVEPPAWAKLQRELLDKQTEACVEFFGAREHRQHRSVHEHLTVVYQ